MRLGHRLPDRDQKSVEAIEGHLLENPRKPVVCLTVLDGSRVTTDIISDKQEVFARIRMLVPLAGEDLDEVEGLVRRAIQEREGQQELPLDIHDEIDLVFDDVFGRNGKGNDDGGDESGETAQA